MGQANLVHGNPLMVDHTPSGADVTAGDVVVIGDLPLVAHNNITDGDLGALAAGGGVYECTTDAAITEGSKVWWDDGADQVTETSTGNKVFGYIAPGWGTAGSATTRVIHDPKAS